MQRVEMIIPHHTEDRKLNMRNTPEIKFVMDQSIAYGVAMSKKIDDITKDIKNEEE